jgi:dTDP-4-amino-4,6-dideoxygalactose transaminase
VNSANFLPFALPEIGEEEIDEVVDSLRSGWLTTGRKTRTFESDFTEWLGGGVESIAVNSATAGLHLALEALGIGPGDEVITTTHTFTATAEVVRYVGADPVFVDISADTLCIDPALVASAITARTKAIIPVHFGGLAADMNAIVGLARRHGLHVVEDAAHALTTTCGGKRVGSLDSDVCVFSFYANKTITTGEGGMLVTRNPDVARRARIMRLHGISRDAFDRFTAAKPSWQYEIVAPGFKYNLTDIASAIGIHQLRKADQFQKRRAEIAATYNDAFRRLPIVLPPKPPGADSHAWHLYVIQLGPDAAVDRDAFIEQMYSRGVGVSVHYIPLHLQPYWRDTYGLKPGAFPVSERVYRGAVSLPIYSKMTDDDVKRVVSAVEDSVG